MLTQRLARFVVDTPVASMPQKLLSSAGDAFLDTVDVALAESQEPARELALLWVEEVGGKGIASVWEGRVRVFAVEAAFANGIAAHALDIDDSLPSMRRHPSASMVPKALALG